MDRATLFGLSVAVLGVLNTSGVKAELVYDGVGAEMDALEPTGVSTQPKVAQAEAPEPVAPRTEVREAIRKEEVTKPVRRQEVKPRVVETAPVAAPSVAPQPTASQPAANQPVQIIVQTGQQPTTQAAQPRVDTIAVGQAALQRTKDEANQQLEAGSQEGASDAKKDGQYSRAELLRRKRIRTELRNEDLLQERLEELRLRDETKRTEQLIGGQNVTPTTHNTTSPLDTDQVRQPAVLEEQTVVAPVTETPGQDPRDTSASVVVDEVSNTQAATTPVDARSYADESAAEEPSEAYFIQPRIGVSNMGLDGSAFFEVSGRYSAGVSVGINFESNLALDIGFTHSEFGIQSGSLNPFVAQQQLISAGFGLQSAYQTMTMRQNLFEVGAKLFFLGPDSKIRPFVGAGAGYALNYVNYDQRVLGLVSQLGLNAASFGQDYESHSFLGSVSAGLDVQLSKNVALGGLFKYYRVLSTREQAPLNNLGFWPAGSNPTVLSTIDKTSIGSTLSWSDFFTVQAGVTLFF